MATCKDCVHWQACVDMLQSMGYTVDGEGRYADERCKTFKDRSRFVELPCKVGDPVWFVPDNRNRRNIIETTVEKLVLKSGGVYMKLACNAMYETSCRSIGKTVFFSREEAEVALAKMG